MLRLDQLYFRNFSILFFITLFISAIAGYFLLQKVEIQNHKTMLINMIDQFSIMEEHEGKLADLTKKIREKTSVRVTIIDIQGVVLYESNRDEKGMDNHLNRPEIIDANNNGLGSSIRFSKSMKIDFLYVAKKRGMRFIRMAYALDSINEKFFNFWLKIMGLFALSMFAALWLAVKTNKKITNDLTKIETSLDNLLEKKYVTSFDNINCCKEFNRLSKQITKVSGKLERRDRQKAKYTKNLKLLSKKQGDIISAISHEFKNPVAAIIGYTESIQDDKEMSEKIREKFLDKVVKNAQKISFMIDRLSMAVKLENDSFKPELSNFNIHLLATEVKETLLQKYKNREIILEVDDIILNADRGMFDNLLTNLIENALKYSEDEIVVRSIDSKLEVIDKGIGICESDLSNITKRFFRVDSLSWDNSIGVGLYIVKYILKLHNSYLEIESEPNIGSKFWFDMKDLIQD